jgi:predicted ester cyclase
MSIDQNKAVVRRFALEVLAEGKVDLVDELLAPNYVNKGMAGMDRPGFKAMLPMMAAAMPGRHMELLDLIAEGDAVVARFTYELTLASGEKIEARGLTYYRLANGKIVEDDPITSPDLMAVLRSMMKVPAGH